MSKRTSAELALIFATFIWGLTFPFVRIVVAEISPIVLNFWRGTAASFIFALFVFQTKEQRKLMLKMLPAGCILGLFFYISYLTQATGLQTITSGRSAFITNLSVVLVPLLSPLFKNGRPSKNDIISSCIACVGLVLLTDPLSQTGMRIGDFWTILTALGFSIQIHLLQIYMDKFKAYGIMSFVQMLFIAIFSILCMPFARQNNTFAFLPTSVEGIYSLLFLAVFATASTTWLQARYQHDTTAERAAVIYVLEPVFATIFGFFILHESMSVLSFVGASVMVFSVFWIFLARLAKFMALG